MKRTDRQRRTQKNREKDKEEQKRKQREEKEKEKRKKEKEKRKNLQSHILKRSSSSPLHHHLKKGLLNFEKPWSKVLLC